MALRTTIWFKGEPHSIASVTFSTFVLLIICIGYVLVGGSMPLPKKP
jgi:hypothetical protein